MLGMMRIGMPVLAAAKEHTVAVANPHGMGHGSGHDARATANIEYISCIILQYVTDASITGDTPGNSVG
jgi:hypothetical protein